MGKARQYTIWVGTNSVRGSQGIYSLSMDEDFCLTVTHTHEAYNSGALAFDSAHQRLFAASEGMVFEGQASGGVTSFQAQADGELIKLGTACTQGQRPCRIAADAEGKNVYAANFFGGSLSMISVEDDGTALQVRKLISEPKPEGWMHAMHCVGMLENGMGIGALNISQSEFVVYDAITGIRKMSYSFGEHIFVRSFATKGNYVYVMIQDPGDIYVLEIVEGDLVSRQVIRMQPKPADFYGTSAIAVSPDGRLLFAASRRMNCVAVFLVRDDGRLEQTDTVKYFGETPRDFAVSPDGKLLVTALQASDEVCVHEIDYEEKTLKFQTKLGGIPSPAAIAIRKES